MFKCFASMHACAPHVCSDCGGQRGYLGPGLRVVSCELTCGWWELNLGLQEEQPVSSSLHHGAISLVSVRFLRWLKIDGRQKGACLILGRAIIDPVGWHKAAHPWEIEPYALRIWAMKEWLSKWPLYRVKDRCIIEISNDSSTFLPIGPSLLPSLIKGCWDL